MELYGEVLCMWFHKNVLQYKVKTMAHYSLYKSCLFFSKNAIKSEVLDQKVQQLLEHGW